MKPRLWISYDYGSTSECLSMLDAILKQHPNRDIIHEIGRPILLQALLEGFPIAAKFRQQLNNYQTIVADFRGYDAPHSVERRLYHASLTDISLTDIVTVMATAPTETVREEIFKADLEQKLVVFDLMSCFDNDWKVLRAQELADLGAKLISCQVGWTKQASKNSSTTLIDKVCSQLKNSSTRLVIRGEFKLSYIKNLKPYVEQNQIFAIAVGKTITRSQAPNVAIAQFLTEINKLVPGMTLKESYTPQFYTDATWAEIDKLTRRL